MIPAAQTFGERFEAMGRKDPQRVSLVFPAFNRLEFTRQSWAALMANTDWSLVSEFHVYDDGSTDGTADFLYREILLWWRGPMSDRNHVLLRWHNTRFHSPMGLTLDWIRRSEAPLLAKLDNDTIYPPGWLQTALAVMDKYPKLDMLGLEAMRQVVPAHQVSGGKTIVHKDQRNYLTAKFISGLGIYRRSAFTTSQPEDGGYFGLEEWQMKHTSKVKAGWIVPSLPVFLLDRMPMEPWCSLSEEYVRKGWQRKEGTTVWRYKPEQGAMWSWWKPVS